MAKAGSLTVNVRIDGGKETLQALSRLPKEANNAIRDEATTLARQLAVRAAGAAIADEAPQSKLVAPTIRAVRDRVPVLQVGGTRRVGRRKVPAWRVLFGAEFGAGRYPQFRRPHSGRKGYWFFSTVERETELVAKAWSKAADRVVRAWSRGGG